MAPPSPDNDNAKDLEKGADPGPIEETPEAPASAPSSTPSSLSNEDDWMNHLDSSNVTEIKEWQTEKPEWVDKEHGNVSNLLELSDELQIRLILIQGVTKEVIDQFQGIDRDFFQFHCSNKLPYNRSRFHKRRYFFGKWFRRVFQDYNQWKIDRAIADGEPYDLDIGVDPRLINREHKRYAERKGIPRACLPLEAAKAQSGRLLRQALGECVSCFCNKSERGLVAVLVFDAPLQIETTTWRRDSKENDENQKGGIKLVERFHEFVPTISRFKEKLKSVTPAAKKFEQNIQDIVAQLCIEDHGEIMEDFGGALDYVDEHMSDDKVLKSHIKHWRSLHGQWNKSLSIDLHSLACIKDALFPEKVSQGSGAKTGDPITRMVRVNSELQEPLLDRLEDLEAQLKGLSERSAATFNAIMATMSIVESQEAIFQAETVSKLTNLAFFFIPLTLCASIFGMNISEWQDQLHAWTWVVISLLMTMCTYLVLYAPEVATALSSSALNPQNAEVNQTVVGKNAKKLNRNALIFVSFCKRLFHSLSSPDVLAILFLIALVILLLAGYIVGIVFLATHVPFTYGDRVAVAVGFALGIPGFILLFSLSVVDAYHWKKIVGGLGVLFVALAVSIWAVLRYAPLSYSQKISVVVGMGVGLPCAYLMFAHVLFEAENPGVLVALFVTSVILAPVLWAIISKTSFDLDTKVSVSVGLGVSVLNLVCLRSFIRAL